MIHETPGCRPRAERNPLAVDPLVRLGTRRPDRRSPAAVQQLELNSRLVDRPAHQPAERINLANEMTLRRAANRGIARHQGDSGRRERADGDRSPHARGCPRRLDAGVSGADDNYVVLSSRRLSQLGILRHRARRNRSRRLGSWQSRVDSIRLLFSDTEARKDMPEQIVCCPGPGDFFEQRPRFGEIGQHELLGRVADRGRLPLAAAPPARVSSARCGGCS